MDAMLLEAPALGEDDFLTRLVLEGEGYITLEHSRLVLVKLAELSKVGSAAPYGELAVAMGYVVSADYHYALYLIKQLRASAHGGKRPLGYVILEQSFARPTHLLEALEWQTQLGGRIGEIMIQNGWLTAEQVDIVLSLQAASAAA
jgi:hypothetical protein